VITTDWFTPLVQKTYDAHKLQHPLQQHKLALFYLMLSQLMRDDSYVMSQLNVSRHDGPSPMQMTLSSFELL
jgi:hypothetical protein